jgi:hypothetical protein
VSCMLVPGFLVLAGLLITRSCFREECCHRRVVLSKDGGNSTQVSILLSSQRAEKSLERSVHAGSLSTYRLEPLFSLHC